MAKRKTIPSLKIHDFFGTYNTYRIFALQSSLSAFPFANKLGKTENTTFTVLDDFERNSNNYSAHFTVFYAEISQQESIHCLLLENKSVIDQQNQFISKTEKRLSFQTGFLFEESLYLFNNQGLRCFDIEQGDIDYFLLIFAKKNIEKEVFNHFFQKLAPFKAQDLTYLLEREQTSSEKKAVDFLRDFYCKYEVKANHFSRKKEMKLLAPVKQIPHHNLQFPIPIILENESAAHNLNLSDEYLAFLKEEQ
jgi:hypothetical protein